MADPQAVRCAAGPRLLPPQHPALLHHLTAPLPQASGKLDKFLEKRRKKNAAKDHRYLPSSRRQAGGEE